MICSNATVFLGEKRRREAIYYSEEAENSDNRVTCNRANRKNPRWQQEQLQDEIEGIQVELNDMTTQLNAWSHQFIEEKAQEKAERERLMQAKKAGRNYRELNHVRTVNENAVLQLKTESV